MRIRLSDFFLKIQSSVLVPNFRKHTGSTQPELKSSQLSHWLRTVGCREVHSPPYHPASNGQAERLVRSLKDALRTWNRMVPFDQFLQKLLLTLRTSRPSGSRTASPDLLMWGRRLRHPLTMTEQVGVMQFGCERTPKANPRVLSLWFNTDSIQRLSPLRTATREVFVSPT